MEVFKKLRKCPSSSIETEISQIAELISGLCGKLISDEAGGDKVHVTYEIGEETVQFSIDPLPNTMGRILGSGGKTINAIRTLVMAICAVNGFRGVVEVVYKDKPPR